MRKESIEISVPKNNYLVCRNFTMGIATRIHDGYTVICNNQIPENIRSVILESFLKTSTNKLNMQQDELGYYFIVTKDIFQIKKGQKDSFGYTIEDLNLIDKTFSLIKLIKDNEDESQAISLITAVVQNKKTKEIKFYLNERAVNILFNKEVLPVETFNMISKLNFKSSIVDATMDLLIKHFIESFYNMIAYLDGYNYKKTSFINNKVNLLPTKDSDKRISIQKDVAGLIKHLRSNSKRITEFLYKLNDNINITINKNGYKSNMFFDQSAKNNLDKFLSVYIVFEKI